MNKYQRLQKWVFSTAVDTGHTTNVDKEYHDLLKELVDKAPHYEKLEAKATPYKTRNIESIGDEQIGTCKCGNRVGDTEHYCERCGQALFWSEDEIQQNRKD